MDHGHEGQALAAGVVVGGCRLDAPVGRGGMGTVYRATQLALGREVAVKVVPAEGADPGLVARFKREVRIAAALEHPACVPIYAAGEEDGLLYLVMRLVHGADLGTIIAGEGPLAPERAVGLIAQVAGALDAAHAAGLVHRDVKPANVLVEPAVGGERAYLSDFGLMRRVLDATAITRVGEWVGTVDYVAPEQIDGRPVDHRADVYALTGVLYACLSGHAPFPEGDVGALARAHLSAPPPQLEAGHPAAALGPVIARGMAKRPEERFQSAGALAQAAAAALAGAHTSARAVDRHAATRSVPGPGGRRPARRRRGLALGLLALLLACAGAAVAAALSLGGGGHAHATSTGAPPPPTGARYLGAGYEFAYPAGWRVVEADRLAPSGAFYRTKLVSPDGQRIIIVDHHPGDSLSPSQKAVSVAQGTIHTPGYEAVTFLPATIAGRPAFVWQFVLTAVHVGPPARIDIFQRLGSTAYAVLGEAAQLSQIAPIAYSVAQSLRTR